LATRDRAGSNSRSTEFQRPPPGDMLEIHSSAHRNLQSVGRRSDGI